MNWYKTAKTNEQLYVQSPDPIHNNWGIVFMSQNQDKLKKFITHCQSLPKDLQAFWQSGSHKNGNTYPDYQYFEFFSGEGKQDLILETAEKISKLLNVNLEIK